MNNKHENQLCAKFISAILRPLLKRKGKTKLGNEKNKNSFVEEKKNHFFVVVRMLFLLLWC